MNKYKILFDTLKPKVGSDPARIIIYDIYCDDLNELIEIMDDRELIVTSTRDILIDRSTRDVRRSCLLELDFNDMHMALAVLRMGLYRRPRDYREAMRQAHIKRHIDNV